MRGWVQRNVPFGPAPKRVFIACFPKSGSTYLYYALKEITGFRGLHAVETYGHNEQNLSERLIVAGRKDSISQHHSKAGRDNLRIMRAHGIRPVIMLRNLFDVVPSLHDHIERLPIQPFGYVHAEYAQMDKQARLTFIIRNFLPWYLQFLMSWREARRDIATHWLTYERLFADQQAALVEVLRFYELPFDEELVARGLARATERRGGKARFNKGVAGRGLQELTPAQIDMVRELAATWRVDCPELGLVGLTSLQG